MMIAVCSCEVTFLSVLSVVRNLALGLLKLDNYLGVVLKTRASAHTIQTLISFVQSCSIPLVERSEMRQWSYKIKKGKVW